MDKPTKPQAGFTVDPAWISDTVRNEKTVDAFVTTSVALANLAAELGAHLEEESFSLIREQIADTVQFLGETLVLVTPPAKLKDMTGDATPEVIPEATPEVQAAPAPVAKAAPAAARPASAAVASVLKGMNPAAVAALAKSGIGGAPAKPAPVPAPVAPAPAPAVAPTNVSIQNMERTENALIKTAKSDVRIAEDIIQSALPADGTLANHPIVVSILGGPAKSDYEAAAVLAETWRK
jgi:hypothetical protein